MEKLHDIDTVIFDLDGTFYDKRGLAKRMVRRLWWCLPLMAIDRVAKGRCWRWIVSTRWHRQVYLPTMVDLIKTTCPRREEVVALWREAQEKHLRTAIYSDYGCVEEKLKVLDIDSDGFDLIITAPELGNLKPDKACAEQVLNRLGADPKTTLFVGDRDEKDGSAARAVGAKFLLIT
ncbi:MAG: HAD family hydrolase [Paludibacteraceae bacterium]|nr:HAD family hydrolase [Paludibacteraceae bacterium]